MDNLDASARLSDISSIGPYFAVAGEGAASGWIPWRRLLEDRGLLVERVETVRSALAERLGQPSTEIDARACASTHFLTLASRLLAPALAGVVVHGVGLYPDPEQARWQPVAGGPIPLMWPALSIGPAGAATEGAEAIEFGVLQPMIVGLADAFEATFAVSPQVLLGNAASALNGAATMLRASERRLLIDPAEVITALLAGGTLAGTAQYRRPLPSRAVTVFVRNNCCLFYRIPGGGTCGDCVLVPDEARVAMAIDTAEAQ